MTSNVHFSSHSSHRIVTLLLMSVKVAIAAALLIFIVKIMFSTGWNVFLQLNGMV